MEVTFIRHTSVDVPPGVCYGQSDVPLRDSFEQEAAITSENLKTYRPQGRDFDCGYPDAEHDKRIMEINFGDWEMQKFDEISDPRLKEWYTDYMNVPATNGESFAMQYQRVASFLDELKEKEYAQVAIFAHGGVLICAQLYAGTIKPEEAFSALTPYGGIIQLKI